MSAMEEAVTAAVSLMVSPNDALETLRGGSVAVDPKLKRGGKGGKDQGKAGNKGGSIASGGSNPNSSNAGNSNKDGSSKDKDGGNSNRIAGQDDSMNVSGNIAGQVGSGAIGGSSSSSSSNSSTNNDTIMTEKDRAKAMIEAYDKQFHEVIERENAILRARVLILQRACIIEVEQVVSFCERILWKQLDHWLGARIRGEQAAIETLLAYLRGVVHMQEALPHPIHLENEDVYVQESIHHHALPPLPSGPQRSQSLLAPYGLEPRR